MDFSYTGKVDSSLLGKNIESAPEINVTVPYILCIYALGQNISVANGFVLQIEQQFPLRRIKGSVIIALCY